MADDRVPRGFEDDWRSLLQPRRYAGLLILGGVDEFSQNLQTRHDPARRRRRLTQKAFQQALVSFAELGDPSVERLHELAGGMIGSLAIAQCEPIVAFGHEGLSCGPYIFEPMPFSFDDKPAQGDAVGTVIDAVRLHRRQADRTREVGSRLKT